MLKRRTLTHRDAIDMPEPFRSLVDAITQDDDGAWFAAHPGERMRRRRYVPGECWPATHLEIVAELGEDPEVLVLRIGDKFRARVPVKRGA